MKLRLITTALLALAGSAFIASTAHAQTTTYSQDDLILGFEDLNGNVTNDYEVDIGSISTYANATGTINVGSFGLDLTNVFGANYETANSADNAMVAFGIVGAIYGSSVDGYANDTLFLSNPETTPGTANTPFSSAGGGQAPDAAAINSMADNSPSGSGSTFVGESETGTTAHDATIVASSGANSYTTREGGINNGFGTGDTVTQSFANGPSNAISDLDVVEKNGTTEDLGYFEFDSAGDLTFTSAQAVPEPSTYVLLALGALFLVRQFHRRKSTTTL